MRANYYGSQNVAILSELNIFSLSKIYGQCENLILICEENIWTVKKKEMQPLVFFFFCDQMFCFSK